MEQYPANRIRPMKWILVSMLLLQLFPLRAQLDIEWDVFGGGSVSVLQFKEFKAFVDSYNEQNNDLLTKELRFNPLGVGYYAGSGFRMNWFYSSLSAGFIRTLDSKARIQDQERHFYFQTYLFDLGIGARLGKGKLTWNPHVNMTICSMNLSSYYQYENGEKSFGSDNKYGGVYTSFKMTARVGLMTRYQINDKWGISFDLSCFPQAKKYGGGSFDYSTSGTFGSSFPKSAFTSGFVGVDDAMTETYRHFTFDLGLTYIIFKSQHE